MVPRIFRSDKTFDRTIPTALLSQENMFRCENSKIAFGKKGGFKEILGKIKKAQNSIFDQYSTFSRVFRTFLRQSYSSPMSNHSSWDTLYMLSFTQLPPKITSYYRQQRRT